MRTKAFLCILTIAAGCGGSGSSAAGGACVTLAGGGQLAGIHTSVAQVQIEAQIVAVDRDSMTALGITFPLGVTVQTDNGGTFGGLSRQGKDVVAGADTLGGPAAVPYLVPNGFDGFLSIVNRNFLSPFDGEDVKPFITLPFAGECIRIDDAATTAIQGFAGGANLAPLLPINPGLLGQIRFDFPDAAALSALIAQIQGDPRNSILGQQVLTTFDGQRAMIVIQDVTPLIGDLAGDFKAAVQSVTPAPLGIFTGAVLDIKPTIVNNQVVLEIRPGTEALSFFRSVPATVGGSPADVEIPVLRSSTNFFTITTPDGQTVVIGDLLRQGETETEKGIPVLGNIPVIGAALRNKTNANQNLMIFVTPHIIPASN